MRKSFALILLATLGCNHPQTGNTGNTPATVVATKTTTDTIKPVPVANEGDTVKATPPFKDTIKIKNINYTGPATIVYKTKADYYNRVPVIMNDDKTKIVSYPAPTDVFYNGQLSYPTKLSKGYLMDNRGINKNVAFLKMTYKEYSQLGTPPSLTDMMSGILDKNPLLEMYNLGSRAQYKNVPADLNKIIEGGELNQFKKLY